MIGDAAPDGPIKLVAGTRDQLPEAFVRHDDLRALLLDRFARAGYRPLRTPVLEPTELHERTSGARIVSKLFRLADGRRERPCLRPEWTASIVRAFTAIEPEPPLPWRVSYAGPVFRQQPGGDVEFTQVGVELLGAPLPAADGEVIWLALWAAAEAGLRDVALRIGHIGVILEMLEHSGLPPLVQLPLIERLSEAALGDDVPAAEDRVVSALDRWLEQLAEYLRDAGAVAAPAAGGPAESWIGHLLDSGRRTGREILARRERKWDLGHNLSGALRRFRTLVHKLADLRGPAAAVLEGLARDYAELAPGSIAKLRGLVQALRDYGIDPDRVELDLGFGRGIGFYSQMVFELLAATPAGPVAVCGGGRYDGLALALGSDRDDRGVGFAFGLERLLAALDAQGKGPAPSATPGTLVLVLHEGAIAEAVRLATRLRTEGHRVVLESGRTLEQARGYASQLGLSRILAVDGGPAGPTTYDLGRGR